MDARKVGALKNSSIAFANPRYGLSWRSIAAFKAGASRATRTAEALVCLAAFWYLELVKKLRSPSVAASSVATPRISIDPSPSSSHDSLVAISESFTDCALEIGFGLPSKVRIEYGKLINEPSTLLKCEKT